MIAVIRRVYELYGFEALETPILEYTDALGKFLPDQDRPNAGVFSLQDEDEQWMSLRYDLTAPLARYVALNSQALPKPFRRYAVGPVFRNEKPGPGRFRQFMQFDADTVGAETPASDAEMCMLAADALEALGVKRGDYIIKVNDRRILDGVLETCGSLAGDGGQGRLTVLRAIDKLDRLGPDGVRQLLGPGRKDDSGDFTKGAGLAPADIERVMDAIVGAGHGQTLSTLKASIEVASTTATAGIDALLAMDAIVRAAGYGDDRIRFDTSVVRGLEYYTGPVFEAELTFEVKDDEGRPVRFGSVGGGGRYDDLVARFTGERVPATGFSIGVSRLQAALRALCREAARPVGPVVVLVMDKAEIASYQMLTQSLRAGGVRAEMYLGSAGMKAQMKYADRRNAPCVIIQGSDERARGEVTVKDLIEGAKAAAAIKNNADWKAARPAQFAVPVAGMLEAVQRVLSAHAAFVDTAS